MAVGEIGGIGPGQVPTDVRALAADIALTNAKILTAALVPGEILTARVGATLGDGNVSLTVRGQTLIANSATTLLPDSLVKLVVQSDGDQPVLRILTNTAPDLRAVTSTPATRAAALGLPATPLATTVLAAFEQVGAPLDSTRLKEAVTQLQSLPPTQVPQRAQAFALLAQAGLPTTPPFLALAERSATGVLPNPAAAVAELQRVVQQQTGVPAGSVVSRTAVSAQPSAPGAQQNALAISQPPLAPDHLPADGPDFPDRGRPILGPGGGSPIVSTPFTSPTTVTMTTPVPAAAPSAAPPVTAPTVPGAAAPTAPASSIVSPSLPQSPVPTVSSPLPSSAPGSPVPASGSSSVLSLPVNPTIPIVQVATHALPDLARGGATAVLQALALAGVRPRDTAEVSVTKSEPTLLHRLDIPVEEARAIRASIDTATRQPPSQSLEAAVVHVMREQAAETVVKPQALIDYDIVLGLPLQVMGQPLPARLAVAERQTSAGTATFLRVDAELTYLGPLSVRISGIENGPMAITVLAAGPALGALAEALPDLNDSLRALGLTAGVRIADLSEDLDHG